jgi:hypothetical protein
MKGPILDANRERPFEFWSRFLYSSLQWFKDYFDNFRNIHFLHFKPLTRIFDTVILFNISC